MERGATQIIPPAPALVARALGCGEKTSSNPLSCIHIRTTSEGGEIIAAKKQINLAEIAAQAELSETLSTTELIGKTFSITSVKRVNGMHGETYVGELVIDNESVEAWLSGNVVFRQITALVDGNGLPRDNVTIIRDADAWGEPFVLTDA